MIPYFVTNSSMQGGHFVDIVDVDEVVIGSDMPRRVIRVWVPSHWILHEQLGIKHV